MSWRDDHRTTTVPPLDPSRPDASAEPPSPPPLALWRKVLLILIGVALVGGLASLLVTRHSGSTAARGGGPGATVSQPQTTPATTPAQSDRPPPLLNTGEDWNAIARSIIAYNDWLHVHPHPELLDQIMVPTDKDYADTKLGLTNLATKGWHYDPALPPTDVQHVEVSTRISPTRVGVVIKLGPAPQFRVVDPTGKVIQDTPATTDGNLVEWTLVQSPGDPHWRLVDVLPL
ncbi:MAG: hypothetical protein M3066_02215 [Actinomycetota bacterium]|nr:hypothetical protein [Actinomycetota bacterium]